MVSGWNRYTGSDDTWRRMLAFNALITNLVSLLFAVLGGLIANGTIKLDLDTALYICAITAAPVLIYLVCLICKTLGTSSKPTTLYKGNAISDAANKGWFVGWFQKEHRPELCSSDVEIKWFTHPTTDFQAVTTDEKKVWTITILVSGRLRVSVDSKEFTLENPGDFVCWGPGHSHGWQPLDESLVITVRWPSIP